MYKAKILSKPRVCNSSNKTLIRVLWPLCTCPAYILTLLQISNYYLENCRLLRHEPYYVIFIKSRVCNSSNKKLIRSSVTFMNMPILYSYFAFISLSWKLENLHEWEHCNHSDNHKFKKRDWRFLVCHSQCKIVTNRASHTAEIDTNGIWCYRSWVWSGWRFFLGPNISHEDIPCACGSRYCNKINFN